MCAPLSMRANRVFIDNIYQHICAFVARYGAYFGVGWEDHTQRVSRSVPTLWALVPIGLLFWMDRFWRTNPRVFFFHDYGRSDWVRWTRERKFYGVWRLTGYSTVLGNGVINYLLLVTVLNFHETSRTDINNQTEELEMYSNFFKSWLN